MDVATEEFIQTYDDLQLGYIQFREKNPGLNDEDALRFFVEKGSETQDNLERSSSFIRAWGTEGFNLLEYMVLNDVLELRKAGLQMLGELAEPQTTFTLIEALSAWEDEIREIAIESMVKFVAGPSALAMESALSHNKDWRVRAGVAEVLGQTAVSRDEMIQRYGHGETEKLIATLMDNLAYKEPRVRSASALALGHLQIESARSRLEKLASSNTRLVNVAAIEALVEMGTENSSNFLHQLLRNRNKKPEVKIAALAGISKIGIMVGFENIARHRNDNNPSVRKNLARLLTIYPHDESISILIKMLDDPSEEVRDEASNTLIEFGNPAIRSILDRVYNRKGSTKAESKIRFSALQIIDEFDLSANIPDLIDVGLLDDDDASVRLLISQKLHFTKERDRKEVGRLVEKRVMKEPNPQIQALLVQQLYELQGDGSKKTLTKVLQNKQSSLNAKTIASQFLIAMGWQPRKENERLPVAIALRDWNSIQTFSEKKVVNYVVDLLSNEDPKIRMGMLDIIYNLDVINLKGGRRKKILAKVRDIAKKDESYVQEQAIPILGLLQDHDSRKQLQKYWKYGVDEVRMAVIRAYDLWVDHHGTTGLVSLLPNANEKEIQLIKKALTNIQRDQRNFKILAKAFRNPNINVRRICSEAVIYLASPELVPFLRRELDSKNRFVRQNTALALHQMQWVPKNIGKDIEYYIGLRDWNTVSQWNVKDRLDLIAQELEFLDNEAFLGPSKILSQYKKSSKLMEKLLKSKNDLVKIQAMQILAYNEEDKKGITKILHLHEDKSEKVRLKVAELISRTKQKVPKSAVKPLKHLMFDKSLEIQIAASRAFKKINDMTIFDPIVKRCIEGETTITMQKHFSESLVFLGDKVAAKLMKVVDSTSPDLVEVTNLVLPRLKTEKNVNMFLTYLDKGKPIQVACAAATLVNIDYDKYVGEILKLFRADSPLLRLTALKAVGSTIPEGSVVNYIVPLLDDNDVRIRYFAGLNLAEREWRPQSDNDSYLLAKALGKWEEAIQYHPYDAELEEEMLLSLRSHIPALVHPTAISMARLAGKALDILSDLIFSSDQELAKVVKTELLNMGEKASSSLINAYTKYTSLDEREILIDMMAQIRSHDIEYQLIEIIHTERKHQKLRLQAMHALAPMDSTIAIPVLVESLSDDNSELAQLAADELVDLGEHSVGSLVEKLSPKNKDLMIHAAQILGRVKSQSAVDPLLSFTTHSDLDIRHAAGSALRYIGWRPLKDSRIEIDFYIATEQWDQIARLGDISMIRLIEVVRFDNNASVRDNAAEIMRTIWPSLPSSSKENYERQFRRLLGPRAHPVFEFLIDFGYDKESKPILVRIGLILKKFMFTNIYFVFAIITAFILIAFVNSRYEGTQVYKEAQFSLLIVMLILQFGQSAFITNYAERFVQIMENVAGVFGRGKKVAIWANRHFSMIVGIIFMSTLYKILTKPPGDIEFIENQDSLIGKVMMSVATGRLGFTSPSFNVSFPKLEFTDWFGIVDLPSFDVIFIDTKLSLILRGIIFLAIAVEVYRVGWRAIYQQNTIPNDPPKFYQKFALPLGLLIFYMLAFVEESSYVSLNESFSEVPLAASRLGILVGSLVYLIFYSKDKPLGWLTVYLVVPFFLLLKFLEIILIEDSLNPFESMLNDPQLSLIILLVTMPFTLLLNYKLVRLLLNHPSYTKDHATVNVLVSFSWRLWFVTYFGYISVVLIRLSPESVDEIIFVDLVAIPVTIVMYVYIIWLYRNFRKPVLRFNALFSLLPVMGSAYLIWGKQSPKPSNITIRVDAVESQIPAFLFTLGIIPLIFLSIYILNRTKRLSEEEADLEGVSKDITRKLRTSQMMWIFFILVYGLVYSVELFLDIKLLFDS